MGIFTCLYSTHPETLFFTIALSILSLFWAFVAGSL